MREQKLSQRLRISLDMGVFEPEGDFLELDAVEQIDLLNDWLYDIDQYRRHVMALHFLSLEKREGDKRTWKQKLAAFRKAGVQIGLYVPDDFEVFVGAHRGCESVPIKPESCPVCNPQY